MKRKPVYAALMVGLLLGMAGSPAEAAKAETAEIAVDGVGFLRDRELKFALNRLLSAELKTSLDANAIEDAAVILLSALAEEGFQNPTLDIEATLADGSEQRFRFDPTFANPLPRPLSAHKVSFRLEPGIRSHVQGVEISGLTAVPLEEARAYFRSDATLLATARTNAYHPARVTRAADALEGNLRQQGYAEARVKAEKIGDEEGPVAIRVDVHEGPQWMVANVRYQRDEDDFVELPPTAAWLERPWSPTLQEDIRELIRQAYYVKGYPDVGVHVEAEPLDAGPTRIDAEVVATIVPGPHVTVGQVRFEGNATTRESVLRRRVRLEPGDSLNPVGLERARYRISRLGVFELVDLQYEPADGTVRDAVFRVEEGPRYETHLLFGYGSYEQLRGGVEHRQMNIFGLAHQSRLELVQSLKSSSGTYSYTVPELFGETLDGTARLFGLQREEIAFLRQEFGLNLSLRRQVRPIGGEATAGYTFQALRTHDNTLSTQETDAEQINVASINFGISGDRRDSPLRPRHGYHWSAQIEAADPRLGGQATYQRSEVAGAYHTNWGDSRWIHVGLAQGYITTLGSDDRRLPVNKRFFPGGDNSIRGYQKGEAAPRDAEGRFLGAKSFLLFNLELEQALTPNWSVVAFGDAVASGVSLRDPLLEKLYAVGLGLRYQTLIGPVRLEYGRNLNRRPADPSGTWHFALGYPF